MYVAKKRKAKSAGRRKKATKPLFIFKILKWSLVLVTFLTVTVGLYGVYLAKEVRVKFEGKRWAVPARVYARPLEFYVGATIGAEQLVHELRELGYRKVRNPQRTAQWSRNKGRFLIRTRAFQFWDEMESERFLDIRIDHGVVGDLRDATRGAALDLVRLEPPTIGSIYPSHKEDRVLVKRAELPSHLVDALLAIEDRRFFSHIGIDLNSILRAVWINLRAGRAVQGGSTLTQQLVKNFFLTPERSLWRKANEALMALILEARYDKDEILEAYANEIFLGQDGERAIHGFGLAAFYYFNRPLQELSVAETALLVGLVKGASYYNPRRHPERAKARRDLVLDVLFRQGGLDAAALAIAKAAPLGVSEKGRTSAHSYPAFVDLVKRQLQRDYREEDLTSEGLRVFTTLDPWAQREAQRLVDEQISRLDKTAGRSDNQLQGAVVLTSAQGGEVQALVGGKSARFVGFNRALDAIRPIGSLVKPAVYLTALSRPDRYHLLTPLEDEAITLRGRDGQVWQPDNYDRETHGRVALHDALTRSLNLATVHLGLDLGLDAVIETLRSLGVEREIAPLPSLLLGAVSASPIEVAQIYQTLASGGFRSPLRAIREVLTETGEPLQRYPLTVNRAADAGPVFLLGRNLVEVVRMGTGRGLSSYLGERFEVAGKTGTTNDLRDSWFAGFTGDRVGVVWIGRDDNGPTGLTGSSGALPVWGRLMRSLQATSVSLTTPESVDYQWILPESGLLADRQCPGAVAFPFVKGSGPREWSACAQRAESSEATGLPGFFERLFRR